MQFINVCYAIVVCLVSASHVLAEDTVSQPSTSEASSSEPSMSEPSISSPNGKSQTNYDVFGVATIETEEAISKRSSSSYMLSTVTLDIKNTGVKDSKGYGIAAEYWLSLSTPYLSFMIQPGTFYTTKSEELLTQVDPPQLRKVNIPTIGTDIFNLITAGPTLTRSFAKVRPFMGIGYSASLTISMYGSGDTAYLLQDLAKHFDLGLGIQSSLFDRLQFTLLYMKALNLRSNMKVTTGKDVTSYTSGRGDWSLLMLNADLMLSDSFGLGVRYQADKTRGRDKGIKDTILKTFCGVSVLFLK